MKKTILAIVFLLFLPIYAEATTAASCENKAGQTDVQDAVNATAQGGTVTIPAGSCSWDTTLTVTTSITIQGAGSASTVITAASGINANGMIYYLPSDASAEAGQTFRVTGLTLDTNQLATDAVHIRNMSNNYVQIRIDHNSFLDSSADSTYRMVRNEGTIKGVIDSNTFNTSYKKMVDSYGQNSVQDWSGLDFSFGSANNIYIEDNTFTHLNTPHSVGQGGRQVIRYNTYTYNGSTTLTPWMDAHGNQDASTCQSWATRGVEWYGNVITSTNNREIVGLSQRGGQALGFYNKVVTSAGGNNFWIWEEYRDASCSATYTLYPNNSYYWSNLINASAPTYEIEMDNYDRDVPTANDPPILAANVTHWTQNASFDGTAGVGCGTLASRPATCTTGTGYWATSQSCSDLTGMVGTRPTPISGTLYKCTATNTWTAYYTPYTYPHPLRGETVTYAPWVH